MKLIELIFLVQRFLSFKVFDELVTKYPPLPTIYQIPQDLVLGQASLEGISNLAEDMRKGLSHKILATPDNNEQNLSNYEKKIMRRVTERQRREQLASLYGSLRLILPLEFIKVNFP